MDFLISSLRLVQSISTYLILSQTYIRVPVVNGVTDSSCGQVFQSKDVPDRSTTPEEFIRMTKGITIATAKAVAAGNSAQQEDVIATANLSRKAISDMLTTCKVLIHTTLPVKASHRQHQAAREHVSPACWVEIGQQSLVYFRWLLPLLLLAVVTHSLFKVMPRNISQYVLQLPRSTHNKAKVKTGQHYIECCFLVENQGIYWNCEKSDLHYVQVLLCVIGVEVMFTSPNDILMTSNLKLEVSKTSNGTLAHFLDSWLSYIQTVFLSPVGIYHMMLFLSPLQQAACYPDVGDELRSKALQFGSECTTGYINLLEQVLQVRVKRVS